MSKLTSQDWTSYLSFEYEQPEKWCQKCQSEECEGDCDE